MPFSLANHIVHHAILDVPDRMAVEEMIKGYQTTFDWQESVIDQLTYPPLDPDAGDRYLIIAVASGAWTGHDEQIAEYYAPSGTLSGDWHWDYTIPDEGTVVFDEDIDRFYVYNDTWPVGAWVPLPQFVDHGNLLGLGDDDHAQYLYLPGRGGQTLEDDFTVSGELNVTGDVTLVGGGTIFTTDSGMLVLDPTPGDVQVVSDLLVHGALIFNSPGLIQTLDSGILTLQPANGYNTIIDSSAEINGDLDTNGDLAVTGALDIGGNIQLGGGATISSDVGSISILPGGVNGAVFGTSGDLALDGDLTLTGGGTIATTSNGNLSLIPNGTGNTAVGLTDKNSALLLGNTTPVGSLTAVTANGTTTLSKGTHGLTLAAGELLQITSSSTAANLGYYRIASSTADTIVVGRAVAGAATDIALTVYKDVIAIQATDGTLGQQVSSYSAQNKPLILGGTAPVAASSALTGADVMIPGALEVDGAARFDSATYTPTIYLTGTASQIYNNSGTGAALQFHNSYQSSSGPAWVLTAAAQTFYLFNMSPTFHSYINYGVAAQTDPTIALKSGTGTRNQFALLSHDRTNAAVSTLTGGLAVKQVASSAAGTFIVASIPAIGVQFTIGADTWTFATTRSGAGEVTIGASTTAAAANMNTAIGLDKTEPVTVRVDYSVVTVYATATGTAGNSITLTASSAALTVSAATLTGGQAAASGVTVYGDRITDTAKELNLGTAASTGNGLASGDVIVGGALEVDGTIYADGGAVVTGQIYSVLPTTLEPAGTTQTIDWDNGNGQVLDLGSAAGDVTLTLSNPRAGASYCIKVIQGAVARTLVWPGTVKWPGGAGYTPSTGNDDIDLVSLFYDGTNYLATAAQDFA